MTAERWRRIEELYHEALTHDERHRAVFLAEACAGDDALRLEVESLLAQPTSTGGFWRRPAVATAAHSTGGVPPAGFSATHLGGYQVRARIGKGGMGEVYRARDTRLKRDVAIKVLSPAMSADPHRLARFEQEARAAAALNHPNIVAIYGIGTHDGAPYIVSELLDGETMRGALAGLSTHRAIGYAIQVAQGLAAAHQKGIVHRDLKPENLFVTKDGRVKILDFGLAKLAPAAIALDRASGTTTALDPKAAAPDTMPGVVVGTVGYMSPEQVRGDAVDHRSDIFSFGAVLYELLCGRKAFQRDSVVETMGAILTEEPAPLLTTNPSLPP